MLNISGYVDPGVYIGEVVVPGQVTTNTVPLTVCLIANGNRSKRVNNEVLIRGLISETVTPAVTVDAHDFTLAYIGNRKTAQMSLTKDGAALDSATDWAILPATLTGPDISAGLDLTLSHNLFSFSIDGLMPLVFKITYTGTSSADDSVSVSNGLITRNKWTATPTTFHAADFVDSINAGIQWIAIHNPEFGYTAAYGSVASVSSNKIVLSSPVVSGHAIAGAASAVKTFVPFPATSSQTVAMFGATAAAPTIVRVANAAYSNTSTYSMQYVSVDSSTSTDATANSNVSRILRVGNYAGVTGYKSTADFTLNTSPYGINWSPGTAAAFTSFNTAATYDLILYGSTISVSFDSKAALTIDLNAALSVPGWASPSTPATGAQIVNNINAAFANDWRYGPVYGNVATFTGGNQIALTSPTIGSSSNITLSNPPTDSGMNKLFGLTTAQLDATYTVNGTGAEPIPGTQYFATYEYTRDSTEYNVPKKFYSPSDLYADIGFPTVSPVLNRLAIAAQICFVNGAPAVMVVQVNDATTAGKPTVPEMQAGIDGAATVSTATEIVPIDTRLDVQVATMAHVTNQCGSTVKHPRRGWFGMARGTAIGDKDTANTYVYEAMRTLQVPGDSPARGRFMLVAPADCSRDIVLESGATVTQLLDGSYVAAAVAAITSSFTSPSEVLLRKNVAGFNTTDFKTYLPQERAILATAGVTVITLDAGKLVLTDPLTTEAGGGNLTQFAEPSASVQKDAVTIAMTQTLDSNLVAIVPYDISVYLLQIKQNIAAVLKSMIISGAIGPFKSSTGVSRDVDMSSDILVYQVATDPTKYYFKYYFNIRLPAKRLFGEYSVNNPFWQA